MLSPAEQRLQVFADFASEYMWETDADFRSAWVSPGIETIIGMPERYYLGRKFENLNFLAEQQNWAARLDQCKAQLEIDDFSFWNTKLNGERQFLAVNAKPLFGPDGEVTGYCGITRDVTDRKIAEDAMRLTTGKFDNLIDGTRQGLIISNRDRKILFCNQTAAEIFGYASSDEILALRESFDLIAPNERARLIKHRTSRFDGENPQSVIVFEGLRKNGDFIHIEGYQRLLNWEGQPVDYVALRVIDTGEGIPKDIIEHVFEPFFTTKDVGAGSGLGLSMVHGFAQQSGGFVEIESEEGAGTTVSIYLPRSMDIQDGENDQTIDVKLPVSRGETILVVEDEVAVREATKMLLERLGYNVLVVEDGAAALDISYISGRIDLVLSDIVLPGSMNGIDVFNQLHEQRPDLKCLFMSGYASFAGQQLPEGAELLSKPVLITDLAAKTRQALDA